MHMVSFRVGDLVRDREDEASDPMVVLDPARGPAESVYIDALDATVAEVNEAVPPDDPVIRCVHKAWLDRNVGEAWTSWSPEEIPDQLRSFAEEWSLEVPGYDYPASRLTRIETGTEPSPNEDTGSQQGQSRLGDWSG